MKSSRTDGFHLVVGASAVIVGLVRLFRSAGTGWSLLLVGLGLVLLATQWIIANDVGVRVGGFAATLVALLGGVLCLGRRHVPTHSAAPTTFPISYPGATRTPSTSARCRVSSRSWSEPSSSFERSRWLVRNAL